MWMDPIELAAMRGENQREANRRGIDLQELLDEQYQKSYPNNKDEKLKSCRPEYKVEEKRKSIFDFFKRIFK